MTQVENFFADFFQEKKGVGRDWYRTQMKFFTDQIWQKSIKSIKSKTGQHFKPLHSTVVALNESPMNKVTERNFLQVMRDKAKL